MKIITFVIVCSNRVNVLNILICFWPNRLNTFFAIPTLEQFHKKLELLQPPCMVDPTNLSCLIQSKCLIHSKCNRFEAKVWCFKKWAEAFKCCHFYIVGNSLQKVGHSQYRRFEIFEVIRRKEFGGTMICVQHSFPNLLLASKLVITNAPARPALVTSFSKA